MAAKQIRDAANGTATITGTGAATCLSYATTSGETGCVLLRVSARDGSGRRATYLGHVGYENIAGTLTIGTLTQIAKDQNAAVTLTVGTLVAGTAFQIVVGNTAGGTTDFYCEAEILRC